MSDSRTPFKQWMVIELYGHQKIAGLVTEESIGGASFIRVDVPEIDGSSAFTKYFGHGAIYAMTPTTQEIVERVAGYLQVAPISRFELNLPMLPEEVLDIDEDKDGGIPF